MKNSIGAIASLCLLLAVACTSGTDSGYAGNTELNLDILNPDGDTGAGFSVDRVDYRITCAGNPPGSYPIAPADTAGTDYNYDDSVDISGAFETVDTRDPPVWQAVMDLPPGDCTITLSVYQDDEIVCVGSQTLAIAEDATTKYDIVLVCSLSIDTPDGMADVDGEFFFITGNICPKLYVLNAVPSVVVPGVNNPHRQSEIQYRVKDPDNTCGNNCDPQTCDFSNPPVCTPYPSNINDPACNPAAGGDPNSVACQDGSHAGLVCTISAFETSIGQFAGNFISPADGVTPIGPIFPVNLNTASGIPGVVLPGLGGPGGTDAANSPAYPPLPNVNGSLPPLVYRCDSLGGGEVIITLSCSDGDDDCDQGKQITLQCPFTDYFCYDPNECLGSGECLTDSACFPGCNPVCDPVQPGYNATLCCGAINAGDSCGVDECERCPGQNTPLPPGALCSEGGGKFCDGVGNCVECISDSDCLAILPPVECQAPPTCVTNSCIGNGAAPAGTPCSNGECDGFSCGSYSCVYVACDPCEGSFYCGQTPASCQNTLSMGCTNNVTADISILPFILEVDPEPIIASTPTNTLFGGTAVFSETFLDAAQGAVPGGVTQADLVNLAATVQIRTGGTMPIVTLTNPPLPTTCLIGGAACDPANDGASVPGSQPNTDCVPTGSFNPCQANVALPTSGDCSVGGVCDVLGKKASQCDLNGFCVTGGLPLLLADQTATVTPAASGILNFGFADQGTGATVNPDGTYALPAAVFTAPTALNEIKVNASGLSVALVCTMAVDSGGPDGVGVPDQASPTPTSLLNTFYIQTPSGGGGIPCNP